MKQEKIDAALNHISSEMHQDNIVESLNLEFNNIQIAHDAIHEFFFLQGLSVPEGISFFEKSAFLSLAYEVFELAHRAQLNALTGHYNAAYSLLRGVYELLLRGAMFECLSKDRYRATSEWIGHRSQNSICLVSISKKETLRSFHPSKRDKITLIEWIDQLLKLKPSIEQDLSQTSIAIYDKLEPILTDRQFARRFVVMPSLRAIAKQLVDWRVIDIQEFIKTHDRLYDILSKNVHVIPDWTDAGRRILRGDPFYEVRVIQEELNKYMKYQHEIMDLGIVIELNIMSDWIQSSSDVKEVLKTRVPQLVSLKLKHATRTLRSLLR